MEMNSIKNKGKVIKMNLSESHKREIAPLCFRVKFSHKKIISLLILLVGLNVIFHSGLLACPIPVFRYALEYWETDNYILDVYYKNELEPGDKALIDLVKSPRNSATRSNLDIRLINVDDDNPDASVIRDKNLQAKSFPWMVLRYPIVTGIKTTLWSGPLNQPNMEKIIHSPVRENLIRLLAKETTAVWILLESGDKKKDQEAYDILSKDLKHLEQTLTLPDPELWWDQSKGIPLEDVPPVKFDILRLSRLNPVEEHFIRMLKQRTGPS